MILFSNNYNNAAFFARCIDKRIKKKSLKQNNADYDFTSLYINLRTLATYLQTVSLIKTIEYHRMWTGSIANDRKKIVAIDGVWNRNGHKGKYSNEIWIKGIIDCNFFLVFASISSTKNNIIIFKWHKMPSNW